MDALVADARYALRGLRSGFLVTVLCVTSLALAVLGNVTVFSIISGLFFRPMPYIEPTRLVMIGERAPGDTSALPTAAAANFLDWRMESTSFSAVAAFKPRTFSLGAGMAAKQRVSGAAVTPGFFSVLGHQAFLGRALSEEDGRQEERVVVLAHEFWQQHFGGAPSVIGQEIRLDDELYSIIGVLPGDFEFLTPNVRIWVPLTLHSAATKPDEKELLVVGRLADSVSMEGAREEMEALWQRLAGRYPQANQGYDIALLNMRQDIPDRRNRQVFALMQGAMLFVLLIACANIANLLLARGQRRRGEMALRAVLGASRQRIIRQLITESVVLAVIGAIIGLALAAGAVRLLTSVLAAALPSFFMPVIDFRVILFLLALTAVAALVFGLVPSLAVRPDLANALKAEGGRTGSGHRRLLGRAFVVGQIAAALMLLAGAGLLTEAFLNVQTASPGFDTSNLLAGNIALPQGRYGPDRRAHAVYAELLEVVEHAPGVQAAGVVSRAPRSPSQPRAAFSIEGSALTTGEQLPHTIWMVASDGYARTLGLSVLHGRFFDARDREDSLRVAVISASLAARYFPNENPIGRRLTMLDEKRVVVGVLPDVRQELALGVESNQLAVYLPVAQHPVLDMTLLVRGPESARDVAEALRRKMREIGPWLSQPQLLPIQEYQARFFAGAQIFVVLLGGFGTLALFLAALGTYGIMAYSVAQRTREMGLRMALGAKPVQIVRLVAFEGLKMAGIGFLLGIPGTIALGIVIRGVIAGISTVSPVSLGIAVAVLCISLIVACAVPAVRVSRLDPMIALSAS